MAAPWTCAQSCHRHVRRRYGDAFGAGSPGELVRGEDIPVIGNSGSAAAKSRSTRFSCSPRAPFQSSSWTIGHQQACLERRPGGHGLQDRRSGTSESRTRYQSVNGLHPLATLRQKLVDRHQVAAGAGVLDELGHAAAAIEVGDGGHHGLAPGLRAGEAHGIGQLVLGNINRRLHEGSLAASRFSTQELLHPTRTRLGESPVGGPLVVETPRGTGACETAPTTVEGTSGCSDPLTRLRLPVIYTVAVGMSPEKIESRN